MNVPDDLRYSTDHEWVRADGGRVRVGITDYAQDALGDVVFVDLPAVGGDGGRRRGAGRGRVDEVGLRDLRPVAGTVVAVNAGAGRRARAAQPGPLRRGVDLRARSWPTGGALDALLDAAAYRELTEILTVAARRPGLDAPPAGAPGNRDPGERLPWWACTATTAGTGTPRG